MIVTSAWQRISPYISIARPDHWFKNIFMVPGVVFALYDAPHLANWQILSTFCWGFLATSLIASSNYTINEILDAPKDALHPEKKYRPIPSGKVKLPIAYALWLLLAVAGLTLGWTLNKPFFWGLALLLAMGWAYNIPPVRLKDLPYLDVLSESVNNPIRLWLGWYTVNTLLPPTLSLIMAYWMIGAFFMTVKRYAEYRTIRRFAEASWSGSNRLAEKYRKSFAHYDEYRLLLSILYYASAFSLFFGIFLIRYRIELVFSIPFLAGFIPLYMRMGFMENSPAQYPEQLYKQKSIVIYTALCTVVVFVLLFVDIPFLQDIFRKLR